MSLWNNILNNLPEVASPTQKKLAFKEKLKWTLLILVLFFVIHPVSYSQNKNYQIEQSIIDVSKVLDIECLINDTNSVSLKRIYIHSTENSYKTVLTDFLVDDLLNLESNCLFLKEDQKYLFLSGNNIFYRVISDKSTFHSDIEILYFKFQGLTFIGYSIDGLNVIDSLMMLIKDNLNGVCKDEIITFLKTNKSFKSAARPQFQY